MTSVSLSATLADLSSTNPDHNVAAIKLVVANYLHEADPTSSIETTEYFNHTFSPDIVLRWKDESVARPVFIRTDARESSLREDLEYLPDGSAFLLPLSEVIQQGARAPEVDTARDSLGAASAAAGAFIATPDSLRELTASSETTRLTRMFSRAVVRAGRGYLDTGSARRMGAAIELGYTGAQRADRPSTQAAVNTVEELLAVKEAAPLNRLLQAVWLGAGGTAADFPGATGVASGTLDVEGLQFLLDLGDVGDDEFWARVGRSVELERLTRLTVAPESHLFQGLMTTAVKRVRGRACGVVDVADELLSEGTFRWFAREGYLGLQARHFRAAFTAGPVAELDAAGEARSRDGLSVRVLLDRLGAQESGFSQLTFTTQTGTRLEISPAEPNSASDDALLAQLTDPLENNADAVSVTIPVSGGRELICDLRAHRARGRTAAKFYITEMLATAIPLFQSLSEIDADGLRDLIAGEDAVGAERGEGSEEPSESH